MLPLKLGLRDLRHIICLAAMMLSTLFYSMDVFAMGQVVFYDHSTKTQSNGLTVKCDDYGSICHCNSELTPYNWCECWTNVEYYGVYVLTNLVLDGIGGCREYHYHTELFNYETITGMDGSTVKVEDYGSRTIDRGFSASFDDGMPIPVPIAYDISQGLRERLCVSSNLIDGCYLYMGELVGIDTNAEVVVLPKGVQTSYQRMFIGCAKMRELYVPGVGYHITDEMLKGCVSLRTICADDALVAAAIARACNSVENIILSDEVVFIPQDAFLGCDRIASVALPSTLVRVGDNAFRDCARLKRVVFNGDAPEFGDAVFSGTPIRMICEVPQHSIGWAGDFSETLPSSLQGRQIFAGANEYYFDDSGDGGCKVLTNVCALAVTNVVVHYILNSIQPEVAVPVCSETGYVNVITEVESDGVIGIPEEWKNNYDGFEVKFGSDFVKALGKPTGKIDGSGKAMLVWQDYVAGTNPMNVDDKFMASVTIVNGSPVISWTPELPTEQANQRKYTVYGKARLCDSEWAMVDGDESNYNFFKVTVKMKLPK